MEMGITLKGSIIEMQEIAKSRGGFCVSKKYINSKEKLWWKCFKGHRWQSTPFSVKVRKSWCPVCANNLPLGMRKMKILAIKNGGKCLSGTYINTKELLKWQCSKGHKFKATPDSIVQGSWCLTCKGY